MHGGDHCGHNHGKSVHKILIISIIITFTFALVEGAGGWMANSLTLMSDAGHMVLDSLALGIAAFGAWLAIKPPSSTHTYGLGRAEVIAAWISSLLMVLLSLAIIFEAIERFRTPHPVLGVPVMIIAFIGLLANLLIAKLLHGTEKTLNVKAALLHVIGDLLGSLAALISGVIIYFSHWNAIDPILSIFISVLIMYSSVKLLMQSMSVLMEKVPSNLEVSVVMQKVLTVNNVKSVHDMHIWTLSSGKVLLSAHIDVDKIENWICTLQAITTLLKKEYHIEHTTLQPELQNKLSTCASQTTPCNSKS